jgi:hypothetical protein
MGAGLVDLAISKRIFIAQGETKLTEPPVIGPGLPNPDSTRVVRMGLLVGVRRETSRVNDPVRAIEKLCTFKDHLYDMLVAMMFRGLAGIEREEEDVHGGHGSSPGPSKICFDQQR